MRELSQKYDLIGIEYDITRKADPEIARRIRNHLQLIKGSSVVDIGCGTGNYTIALQQMGLEMTGADISSIMLDSAKIKNHNIAWIEANAFELPFDDSAFRGAFSTLVIHHYEELEGPFREVFRVISEGRFVIFTSSPEQMRNYWLVEYFPKAMESACKQMPPIEKVVDTLLNVGFSNVGSETFMVQPDLEDFFLYSGKYDPRMYLDAKVRKGISTFASLAFEDEVKEGCLRLKYDIDSGKFYDVISKYNSIYGDYMFIVAEKKQQLGLSLEATTYP